MANRKIDRQIGESGALVVARTRSFCGIGAACALIVLATLFCLAVLICAPESASAGELAVVSVGGSSSSPAAANKEAATTGVAAASAQDATAGLAAGSAAGATAGSATVDKADEAAELAAANAGAATTESAAPTELTMANSYRIVYELNGGKQPEGQKLRIMKGKALKVSKLKNPTRVNFKFCGWYTDKELKKKATKITGAAAKESRTLYAKWKRTRYWIIYNLNGGKQSKGYTKTIKVNATLKVSKLRAPVKGGYSFAGYYTDKSLKKKATKLKGVAKKASRAVYAKWTSNKYKITYKLDGGKIKGSYAKTYRTSVGVSSLPTPTKKGYTFLGWRDEDGKAVVHSIGKGEYGDRTFNAKWALNAVVAHRGYHAGGAVQNSLASFESAADKGFVYVETDIRFTKDDEAVLSHDPTVKMFEYADDEDGGEGSEGGQGGEGSEGGESGEGGEGAQGGQGGQGGEGGQGGLAGNANDGEDGGEGGSGGGSDGGGEGGNDGGNDGGGGGNDGEGEGGSGRKLDESHVVNVKIGEVTLSELQNDYVAVRPAGAADEDGTKNIATFDEFLGVCKQRGLTPIIEMKEGSKEQIASLVAQVDAWGMTQDVCWGSFQIGLLNYVKDIHPKSNFTFITRSAGKLARASARALADSGGEAFIDLSKARVTESRVKACKEEGIELGVWTLATDRDIDDYDSYISKFTVDGLAGDRAPTVL